MSVLGPHASLDSDGTCCTTAVKLRMLNMLPPPELLFGFLLVMLSQMLSGFPGYH